MNEKQRRLAYFAVRQSYPKDAYIIISKNYFVPEGAKNVKFLDIINPCPSWSSDFLVINKNKDCKTEDKLINVWVKFTDVGEKQEWEGKQTLLNGRFTFKSEWLKQIMDDVTLYSNINLADGTTIFNSTSKVIFVGVKDKGDRIYISPPMSSRKLVKCTGTFFSKDHKTTAFESIQAKQYKDPRPVELGDTLALILREKDRIIKYKGIDPIVISEDRKTISIWWLFNGDSPQNKYPFVFAREEYSNLCSQIKDDVLNTSATVCSHTAIEGKKRLLYDIITYDTITEIYNNYEQNKPELHSKLRGVEYQASVIDWLKRTYPNFPIYPNYSWLSAQQTLYYEFKDKIN